VPKKAQITQERVEYNVFLFDEPLKGSKSLKIFKISLTFRFDKLSNLSKSVHTGENSQILTVSNKKLLLKNYIVVIDQRSIAKIDCVFFSLWQFITRLDEHIELP
jgi:flagellar assembly factor FliW